VEVRPRARRIKLHQQRAVRRPFLTARPPIIWPLSPLRFNLNLDDLVAQGFDLATLAEQAAAFGFVGARRPMGGGLTPLVFAARERLPWSAQDPARRGRERQSKTLYGWTPVMTATQNRHYKLAAYLLVRGADPNIANNGGWTRSTWPRDNRNIESGDYPVRTPDMDHLDFIKLLLDKKANPTLASVASNRRRRSVLGNSTETRTNFTMQWLFEDGATPFFLRGLSRRCALMKLLLVPRR
jgi:hypothetical protein